jgi:hypothetical protein
MILNIYGVKLGGLHYKVLYNFSNLFYGRIIQFYTFEDDIFIVVIPLHLQRHTSLVYYNSIHCTFMLVIFPCAIIFFFPPFHNPSLLQHYLLKMCRTVEFLHPLRLPAVSVFAYVKTSWNNHKNKHAI